MRKFNSNHPILNYIIQLITPVMSKNQGDFSSIKVKFSGSRKENSRNVANATVNYSSNEASHSYPALVFSKKGIKKIKEADTT